MTTVRQKRGLKSRVNILEPVSRKTLTEEIVAILKRFILIEDLQKGDRLPPERELAASLGVSHRVVREALSVLAGEGVIVKEQGRGVFVREFDRSRLRDELGTKDSPLKPADLYEVRRAIEVGAMSIAAARATEEDLEKLQEIIDLMTPKFERGESLTAEEIRFHLTLLRSTHNEIFQQMDHLLVECIRYKMYEDPDRLSKSLQNPSTLEEHKAIVDALRARDGARAIREMYTHLIRDHKRLLKLQQADRDLGASAGSEREENAQAASD